LTEPDQGAGQGGAPPPDLSIVVLTCDRARLLRDCLDSLVAQTHPAERVEILVADDGSVDDTARLVATVAAAHANVRYLRHPHRGIPATRNLGVRHARGALIAIVADDYILAPDYAERIVAFFARHPAAEILRFGIAPAQTDWGSRISHAYYQASILRHLAPPGADPRESRAATVEMPREITTQHGLDASGAAAFRREVFDRVGLFDETLARAEDSDLTVRLRRCGVAIHYDPNHPVRHQYDRYLRDTLAKSFLTGWYRYRLYRKTRAGEASGGVISELTQGKLLALRASWAEARRHGAIPALLLALPFAFLFELLNKLGFASSWLWHTLRPAPRVAS